MRSPAILFAVYMIASLAHAQEQEGKLVDRVLKPNMRLKNSAQDKQFNAGGTSVNKKANVAAFYVSKKIDRETIFV